MRCSARSVPNLPQPVLWAGFFLSPRSLKVTCHLGWSVSKPPPRWAAAGLHADDLPKLLEQRLHTLDNAIHRGLRLLLPKDGQLHLLDEDVRGASSVVESRQWNPRSA